MNKNTKESTSDFGTKDLMWKMVAKWQSSSTDLKFNDWLGTEQGETQAAQSTTSWLGEMAELIQGGQLKQKDLERLTPAVLKIG